MEHVVVVRELHSDKVRHVEGPFTSANDAQAYVDEMLEPGFPDLEGVVVPLFKIDEVPDGAYDVS